MDHYTLWHSGLDHAQYAHIFYFHAPKYALGVWVCIKMYAQWFGSLRVWLQWVGSLKVMAQWVGSVVSMAQWVK